MLKTPFRMELQTFDSGHCQLNKDSRTPKTFSLKKLSTSCPTGFVVCLLKKSQNKNDELKFFLYFTVPCNNSTLSCKLTAISSSSDEKINCNKTIKFSDFSIFL